MKYKVKKSLSTAVIFVWAAMVGCSNDPQMESGIEHEIQVQEESHVKSEKLTEIYRDIYNEAMQTNEPDSPEMMQRKKRNYRLQWFLTRAASQNMILEPKAGTLIYCVNITNMLTVV